MGRKAKYTFDQKVQACEDYLSGKKSMIEIAKELNMGKCGKTKVRLWIKRYMKDGPSALEERSNNSVYTKEFKLKVIYEYQHGNSLSELMVKYGIRSDCTIRNWIKKYNRHEEIEDYTPHPEVYSMSARKTTIEERIEIVNWCLEHNKNYKEAASKFNCSYTQVYQWVKKYSENGEDGLSDKRGHRKSEKELTETDRQERELAKLRKRNEELEMEIKLLKKLNAFDWRG